MNDFLLLILSLAVVVHGASLSSRYAERIAEGFKVSRYLVGFVVVSFVSIMPETFIAINAAIQQQPSLGIGTLFGSNVIDLTLIFALLVFIAKKRGIRVEKSVIQKLYIYPLFLTIPLLLGLDGHFSRTDGVSLMIIGIIFYYYMFRKSVGISSRSPDIKYRGRNIAAFIGSMILLLIGAHFTTLSAVHLADGIGVNPILVGVLIVSFGTTLPELFFSAKAIKDKKDALAIGNILGSVLADATIVVGIVAVISPVTFPQTIAYVAGGFMVLASVVLLTVMRTQYRIGFREAFLLIAIWFVYLLSELAANTHLLA